MLTTIQDAVTLLLPFKRKTSSNGWISFNAPCCVHNGETPDNRGRGGMMFNPDGSVSYHCFNCNYKTGYKSGGHIPYKLRKLLSWLGADDNSIKKLVIDAIRIRELIGVPQEKPDEPKEEVNYEPRPLPENAKTFEEWTTWFGLSSNMISGKIVVPDDFFQAYSYVHGRKVDYNKYNLMWTPEDEHNYHKRVIIPFYWKGQLVGSTARAWMDGIKPKYQSDYDTNYVFNTDAQDKDNKFVLVMEGPFDAMAVDGIAVMTNDCNEVKADIIDSLGKEAIVVPDFDVKVIRGKKIWSGATLVDKALEYGWSVSFPAWKDDVKDVSAAVEKYGKLFTLKTILDGKLSNKLKIELHKKRIYGQ